MTVDLQLGRIIFDGDGITRSFPFPFKVFEGADVRLIRVDGAELVHDLLYQHDFDLILHEPPLMGGELAFPKDGSSLAPLAVGERLIISRAVKAVQDTLYPEHSPIFQGLIETSFDKATVLIQQLEEGLGRAVKVPISANITPEALMDDLFGARDESVQSAHDAAVSATKAREQASLAKHHADNSGIFALESNEHAENSLAHANASDEHRDEAMQWATHPEDTPVEHDADDKPLYSAKHWAIKTAQKELSAATVDTRGGVRVGVGLVIEELDKLCVDVGGGLAFDDTGKVVVDTSDGLGFDSTGKVMVDAGDGLGFDNTGKLSVMGGLFTSGHISLLPFRNDELPFGWYFCNNDRYANDTPQAIALNTLSVNFKADWSIVDNEESTNVPNMFHVDGRGVFLRAVDGTLRFVGSLEDDAIRNITGEFSPRESNTPFYIDSRLLPPVTLGAFAPSNVPKTGQISMDGWDNPYGNLLFDASLVVPTSYDNHSLNVGMTPAIYLGV